MADGTFPSGQVFDVGTIVRELNAAYLPRGERPKVSAHALAPLIAWLRKVTDETQAQYDRVYQWAVVEEMMPEHAREEIRRIGTQLQTWRVELGIYESSLAGCMSSPDMAANPLCTTWPIVAPLFFGFYDGPEGTSPQRPPGLMTPFQIANELGAQRQWSVDQLHWTNGWRDVVSSTKNVAGVVSDAVQGTMRALGAAAGAAVSGAGEGIGFPVIVALVIVGFFLLRGGLLRKAAAT